MSSYLIESQKSVCKNVFSVYETRIFSTTNTDPNVKPLACVGYNHNTLEYDIRINFSESRVYDILMMHEVGHIYYSHCSPRFDHKSDYDLIKKLLCEEDLVPVPDLVRWILNAAMDLQVNTTLLTFSDYKYLRDHGINPLTIVGLGLNCLSGQDYHYYIPLIIKHYKPEWMKSFIIPLINSEFGDIESADITDQVKADINIPTPDSGAGPGKGDGHAEVEKAPRKKLDTNKRIKDFLKPFMTTGRNMVPDAMRIYNRKTRSEQGDILYTSFKRSRNKSKSEMVIIVDVSGSMEQRVIDSVLSTIEDSNSILSKNTTIISWNTNLVEQFKFTKLKDTTFKRCGGTELSGALDYASKLGSKYILLVSDFDDNLTKLSEFKSSSSILLGIKYGEIDISSLKNFKSILIL